MLGGTHIVVGGWIYRAAEGRPWWVRWPAVALGGFASHYFLDSIATYHSVYGTELWPWDNHWWPWYNVAFIIVQILAVCAVWSIGGFEGKGWKAVMPPMLLSGLWAWLSWDAERFMGSTWLHVEAAQTWAPRALSAFSRNPWTGLWEVGLVLGLIALVIWKAPRSAEERARWPAPAPPRRAAPGGGVARRLRPSFGFLRGAGGEHRQLRPLPAILILSAVIVVLSTAQAQAAAGASAGCGP